MNHAEVIAHMESAIRKIADESTHVSLTDEEFAAITVCRLESVKALLLAQYDADTLDGDDYEAANMALCHEITRLMSGEKTWEKP
jgi:hypothetical protein